MFSLRKALGLACSTTILSVVMTLGCAGIPPYTTAPFQVDPDQFRRDTRTIVLAPLQISSDISDPIRTRGVFEPLIQGLLADAGFSVITSSTFENVSKEISSDVGGCFDPVTGELDKAKLKDVEERCLEKLESEFKVDAVLYSSIRVFSVRFGCQARWHGVSEDVQKCLFGVLGGNVFGEVPALSLIVEIADLNGAVVYRNGAGIQLLARLKSRFFAPYSFEHIPSDQLFTDGIRNKRSVDIALRPLVTGYIPNGVERELISHLIYATN